MRPKNRSIRIPIIGLLCGLIAYCGILAVGVWIYRTDILGYRKQFDEKKNWRYMVHINDRKNRERDENTLENYYFNAGDIFRFSVAKQDIVERVETDVSVEYFAVCDEYIFFSASGGETYQSAKIWRYDRETEKCELFGEFDFRIYELAVYDGYLFYGYMDIYVCPVDGNPEKDSVSLRALFTEDDPMRDFHTVKYGDWRVGCFDRGGGIIEYIMNEENEDVILSEDSSNDSWFCVDGRFLHFTQGDGRLYYRWEDEEDEWEKHVIKCLNEEVYHNSQIFACNLTVEDGRIIGLLTASKNPLEGAFLRQKDVKYDILFELQPEEHTSEILYRTPNNRTRILGYQAGNVYILQDSVICRENLAGENREQLWDLSEEEWYVYNEENEFRTVYFDWLGDNLIVRTMVDKEIWIKSISVSN